MKKLFLLLLIAAAATGVHAQYVLKTTYDTDIAAMKKNFQSQLDTLFAQQARFRQRLNTSDSLRRVSDSTLSVARLRVDTLNRRLVLVQDTARVGFLASNAIDSWPSIILNKDVIRAPDGSLIISSQYQQARLDDVKALLKQLTFSFTPIIN